MSVGLSWGAIGRLGLVQMALGSVVVLTTSTLNRLMVVELALPAVLPALLVALYYGIQITRPTWGFLSDRGGKRTFWIMAGIAVLALGGTLAALGVVLMEAQFWLGLLVLVVAYSLIGLGVGAAGTSLLALLATFTAPERRAAAAMIVWIMMIGGIAVTATMMGVALDPYSPARLLQVVVTVSLGAILVTAIAVWGIERRQVTAPPEVERVRVWTGLRQIWQEREARIFTVFIAISMTAYFMQELIMEPFAGLVFDYSVGQSTRLAGAQNAGVFTGMVLVGVAASGFGLGALRSWAIAGCVLSALAFVIIGGLGFTGHGQLLVPVVVGLGIANGIFAVAAIGTMMQLAGDGRARREGTRMGIWGAAQAIAAGAGGLAGAALLDILRALFLHAPTAFGLVFWVEALFFLASAGLAAWVLPKAKSRV